MGSELTQFKKGQIANPDGRPKGFKGLAKDIRKKANGDNSIFIEWAWSVWQGTCEDMLVTSRQRWEAFLWLTDRVYGKAPAVIELHTEEVVVTMATLDEYTDDELDQLRRTVLLLDKEKKDVIDV